MPGIYKKELGSYYKGFIGWLFAVPLLVMAGIYCWVYNLIEGYSQFEYTTASLPFVLIFLIPVLTMRVMAEERRQKTDQLLYSLPTTSTRVVLGKYFAMVTVFAVPVCVMALYPLLLSRFGEVSFAMAYGNLFAFFLLGCALISMGQFISCLTDNPTVALVLCLFAMLINYFLEPVSHLISDPGAVSFAVLLALAVLLGAIAWLLTRSLFSSALLSLVLLIALCTGYLFNTALFSGWVGKLLGALCLFSRQSSFQSGIFDLRAVVYYLGVSAVFLFLSVQSMEKRRWNG